MSMKDGYLTTVLIGQILSQHFVQSETAARMNEEIRWTLQGTLPETVLLVEKSREISRS